MIYYPLSVLMLAGIRDILFISTPQDIGGFQRLLGDGSRLGISIRYAVQPGPRAWPRPSSSAASSSAASAWPWSWATTSSTARAFRRSWTGPAARPTGATVFGYMVKDPQRYGVVEFDGEGRALSLEEKPATPRSN